AGCFGQVEPVELGVAARLHVGDVDVADTAVARGVDAPPVPFHPFAVAGRHLRLERLDRHIPRRAVRRLYRQRDLGVGVVDEQLLRENVTAEPASVDRLQRITGADVDTRSVQRRVCLRLAWGPLHYVDDPVGA